MMTIRRSLCDKTSAAASRVAGQRAMLGLTLTCIAALCLIIGSARAASAATNLESRNVAATHRFLKSYLRFVTATAAAVSHSDQATNHVLATVSAHCAGALKNAPRNDGVGQLSEEALATLTAATYAPAAGAASAFRAQVRLLRWSSPRIMQAANGFALKLQRLFGLHAPDLCADVLAYVRSSYEIPTTTQALDARFAQIESMPSQVPQPLLSQYERPPDAALIRQMRRPEVLVARAQATTLRSWEDIGPLLSA